MMFSTRNESPFTATQWEELEHQALIFKYMMCRIPIPPNLLLSLKKNISPVLPNFFAPQHYRWGCFQMGYERTQDPEPGRCRRTDGKKWRCSKDAFPDSKYCERHMHRGRNRSRKLVEMTNNSKSIPSPFSSCFKPSGFDYSGQNDTTQLKLDTGSYSSTDKDCRYPCGGAKATNNAVYSFFSETSDSLKNTNRESHLRNLREFIPLTDSVIHADLSKRRSLDQNYFDLSNDFQLGIASKREREEKEECQHTTHRFFEDWSVKNRDLWSDSRTQLSISIPMTSSD